jgi:L-amino acid N-acyltransferase YncA
MSTLTKADVVGSAVLRRATPADRDALTKMYHSFEPKGDFVGLPPRKEPERWLERLIAYPNFVVSLDGRIIAHAVLCPNGDKAEVAVFVHQDFRGLGFAKKLLGELIAEAKRLGLRRIWAATEQETVPIFRLANKFGFVQGKDPREFYLEL